MDTCWRNDQTGQPATDRQSVGKSCACGNIKTVITDKMHKVAAVVGEKAARRDAQSTLSQYGKQAAEVLDESAEYIQQLDYEQADAKAREYVRRNPGLSLLIAGVTGLIIGAVFRRR
jgi:ElaB/YqjD/DUF883 family membrane-anchored ribosome-binding protein